MWYVTFFCVTASGVPPSASSLYVRILGFHALPICPAIEPYMDVGCQRGSVPPEDYDTISCLQVRYTREFHPYYTLRAHLHRILDMRPSISVQPTRQYRVSQRQFYPSGGP